jgi:hypothetical protein
MRRSVVLLLFLIAPASIISAQPFKKGTNVVSAGVGLGSSFGSFSYGSQTPAISLQYEKGLWEVGSVGVISLGGYVGIKSFKYSGGNSAYNYTEKWSYKIIGVRSAFHYNGFKVEKLDAYAGAMLSYNILNFSYKDNGGSSTYRDNGNYGSAAGLTFYAGGRYFFSKNLAGFAEVGYGVSYLTLGLALKI